MLGAFSCVDARCDSPAERAYLLMQIRLRWGSEAAFDAFVRGTSPQGLRVEQASLPPTRAPHRSCHVARHAPWRVDVAGR